MRKRSTGDLDLLDKGTGPAVIVSMVSRKLIRRRGRRQAAALTAGEVKDKCSP